MTKYEINLKSDELTLMYNEDIGVFIDTSQTDLTLSNEILFSSNKIKIDFNNFRFSSNRIIYNI